MDAIQCCPQGGGTGASPVTCCGSLFRLLTVVCHTHSPPGDMTRRRLTMATPWTAPLVPGLTAALEIGHSGGWATTAPACVCTAAWARPLLASRGGNRPSGVLTVAQFRVHSIRGLRFCSAMPNRRTDGRRRWPNRLVGWSDALQFDDRQCHARKRRARGTGVTRLGRIYPSAMETELADPDRFPTSACS
jgi:hypothetical protein